MFSVILLAIVASAFGQGESQQPVGTLRMLIGAQVDPDAGFGGCSGLGIDSDAPSAPVYWTVSDDVRQGNSQETSQNPRYFDGSILFQQEGGQFVMSTVPQMVYGIPRVAEGEGVAPEGFHFCGEFLYMGNGASDVRRFRPKQGANAQIDGALYSTPDNYQAADLIEGVTKDGKNSLVYAISGQPTSRFSQYLQNLGNFASILEWAAEGQRQLQREFLLSLSAEERVMDLEWESERRFVYLVAVGGSQGAEPFDFNKDSPSSLGQADRPSSIRLYSCQLPAPGQQGQNVLSMDAAEVSPAMMVSQQLLAEFSIADGEPIDGKAQDYLVLNQGGAEVGRVPYARAPTAQEPIMPAFDGIAFGPPVDADKNQRSLFLISDNNFDNAVPTRYISLSYQA